MTYTRVVRCDRPDCLAQYLGEPRWGIETLRHSANRAGWRVDSNGTARCPADVAGRGPVLETGECGRCHGRTRTLASLSAEECVYCLDRTTYPKDGADVLVDDTDQAADGDPAPQV